MKFGKSILSPSRSRKPAFTSYDSLGRGFKFVCANCPKEIEIEYKSLIGEEWKWENEFGAKAVREIKRLYNMDRVGKSPDGGSPAVIKSSCKNCRTGYLIYAGVNEPSNSFYVVTLQGITEIVKD